MGRHATVAGRMASSAAAKGKIFTKLTREIMVASRSGGDPAFNARLRLAVERAREQNMPKENIDRAVKKGTGELEGMIFEDITYEGYGPGGSAIMVETMTDNRNRTNPELRRIFQKGGGNIGEMGSVGWMFKKKGVIEINSGAMTEDKIMEIALDAGADDVVNDEEFFTVYTEATQFAAVREAISKSGLAIRKSGLELIPDTTVKLTGETAKQALELLAKLEDYDDSQNVFHNFDIDSSELDILLG